jgi:hypothetical protein
MMPGVVRDAGFSFQNDAPGKRIARLASVRKIEYPVKPGATL